jgi:hypothetical protein
MTHPDFAEIIAALEPIAQRTGQACSHVFSDFELRCVRDAIPKLRALANVWKALQSSEAYRDARMMWHVGGVLTEAGEEHLALTFSAKDARISKLEKDLYASRGLIRGIQFDCDWMRNVRRRERAEVDRLRTALLEAIEIIDFWSSYASNYFKDKHGLAGDIARLRACAATKPQETE